MSSVPYLIIAPFLVLGLNLPKQPAQILYLKNRFCQTGGVPPFPPNRTLIPRLQGGVYFPNKKGRSKGLPSSSKIQLELFLPALPVPVSIPMGVVASLRRH
jgi:hypothetical protein